MPKGMSKLKHLRFLSDYVVGKHRENKIRELGALANIHQSISISKLENVVNSNEASMARMFAKDGISFCEKLVSTAAFMNSQFQGLIQLSIEGECESVKSLPKEVLLHALILASDPLAWELGHDEISSYAKQFNIRLSKVRTEIEAADKQRRECSDIGITIGATI
ncbi:hypothetical protein AHAS_Ahas02G0257500 [Arachis hypogaea]